MPSVLVTTLLIVCTLKKHLFVVEIRGLVSEISRNLFEKKKTGIFLEPIEIVADTFKIFRSKSVNVTVYPIDNS